MPSSVETLCISGKIRSYKQQPYLKMRTRIGSDYRENPTPLRAADNHKEGSFDFDEKQTYPTSKIVGFFVWV